MRVSRSLSVLSLLVAASCAYGVELDANFSLLDAGRDASFPRTGGHAGLAGSSQAGSSQTAGRMGQGGASAVTTGSGGVSSPGGASAVDASGSGGASPDGALGDVIVAVDTSNGCVTGQKVCGGRCVVPEARIGCDLMSCDPCPTPEHGVSLCTGSQCDFSCLAGYQRSGSACIAIDSGAVGGGGGSGGSSVDSGSKHCVASQCGGCIPVIQAPCCKPDDTCGCQFPFFPCN
jgi:hypothetical protein